MPLTLSLVGAHPPADGRQIALLVENAHRRAHIAHRQLMDKVRNIVADRAARHASRLLTLQTSFSLFDGLGRRKTFVYNVEKRIFCTHVNLVLWDIVPVIFAYKNNDYRRHPASFLCVSTNINYHRAPPSAAPSPFPAHGYRLLTTSSYLCTQMQRK